MIKKSSKKIQNNHRAMELVTRLNAMGYGGEDVYRALTWLGGHPDAYIVYCRRVDAPVPRYLRNFKTENNS